MDVSEKNYVEKRLLKILLTEDEVLMGYKLLSGMVVTLTHVVLNVESDKVEYCHHYCLMSI